MGIGLLLVLLYSNIVWNVFVKPKDQRKLVCFGLARKGRMKSNVFIKPKDQRKLVCFGLARKGLYLYELILSLPVWSVPLHLLLRDTRRLRWTICHSMNSDKFCPDIL